MCVFLRTDGSLFITRETVFIDTPASFATSFIVTFMFFSYYVCVGTQVLSLRVADTEVTIAVDLFCLSVLYYFLADKIALALL